MPQANCPALEKSKALHVFQFPSLRGYIGASPEFAMFPMLENGSKKTPGSAPNLQVLTQKTIQTTCSCFQNPTFTVARKSLRNTPIIVKFPAPSQSMLSTRRRLARERGENVYRHEVLKT